MAARVEDPKDLGLLEGALDLAHGGDVGEVEQGAGDGCGRDAVDLGGVDRRQRHRSMHFERGARPAPARAAQLDRRGDALEQSVQLGGRAVAEHGAVAACQRRGHEPPVEGEDRVSHGVDGGMDSVQAAGLDAVGDRSPA
jgi:hypothetical protein